MADGSGKPSIPAWQRAANRESAVPALHDQTSSEEKDEVGVNQVQEGESPVPEESVSPSSQLEMVEAFLSDPQVTDQSVEKKRAFLRSKEVPVATIDKVLGQPAAPSPHQQPSSGPPIITYPEWMADAHKPPPLITRDRLLNATYLVSGITAVVYGASKFLVNPMIGNLTEARHDFHLHSQSKLEELNERLGKLVSQMPEVKGKSDVGEEGAETEKAGSTADDPTELFHRDIGVQTSPFISSPSSPDSDDPSQSKKDATTYQTGTLDILTTHLKDMQEQLDTYGASTNEREVAMDKLRHSLDTMIYNPAAAALLVGPDGVDWETEGKKRDATDAVEQLKKEIRGVKGVLLSARRFPGFGRR